MTPPSPQNTPAPRRRSFPKTGEVCADGAGGGKTALLHRALFGEPMPITPRGQALWVCRRERATRAWLTVGSYGWWRYTGYLKAAQRQLLTLRYAAPARGGPSHA